MALIKVSKAFFQRPKFGLQGFGDPTEIQVGDSVSFIEDQKHVTRRVEKVNTKAGKARLAPVMYKDFVMETGRSIRFEDILSASRLVEMEEEEVLDRVGVTRIVEFELPAGVGGRPDDAKSTKSRSVLKKRKK